jgi:hypothetical protein
MLAFFKSRFAAITARAHHAATSPKNDLPQPTEGQIRAGNFKKGHFQLHGLGITIENPAGSSRSGVDANGRVWRSELHHHYGYIKGPDHIGADGDHVDCFVGPHVESELVYVIDQVDPETGTFDEHKVIWGARNEAEARHIYQANYPDGWKGLGAITPLPIADFRDWISNHDTTSPIATNRWPLRFLKATSSGRARARFYVNSRGYIEYENGPRADGLAEELP